MGTASGPDWVQVLAAYEALLLFGIAFNAAVAWLQRQGYDEGATALEVVAGVFVTLLVNSWLTWGRPADGLGLLLTLGSFACSGAPMALGSLLRYGLRRRAAQVTLRREAHE